MTSQDKPSEPDHEGPHYEDEGINFYLSRKEPSQHLLWIAGSFGVVLMVAWFGGNLDTTTLLTFIGMFIVIYLINLYAEDNATRDRSIKLRISRQGIEVPERFHGALAWDSVENITWTRHKSAVTLHILPNAAGMTRVPVNTGWRKYLVGKGIDYKIDHLEGHVNHVVAAIKRFAPEHVTTKL